MCILGCTCTFMVCILHLHRHAPPTLHTHSVRARGNLLLCTLLFGNVCVNSAISIVLSDITSGAVGLLLSTVIIVILGTCGWGGGGG